MTSTAPVPATPATVPAQAATIHGRVTYTPGEGVPIVIPEGPIEVIVSADSSTLSWTRDNDVVGSAAIPKDQYQQYVKDGKIRLNSKL